VEVTFDIDANGILSVKAKDKSTGKEQSIRIEAKSGLTDADIEKMKHDAEAHAEEDKGKKEAAETKNLADQMIYTAEKTIKDAGDKISAEIKSSVEAKVADLKKIKDGSDTTAIKKAIEELSIEMQKIGEAMMKNTNNNESKPNDTNEGNVRDAETK